MATVAAFSGCLPRTIHCEDGVLTWAEVKKRIAPATYYRAQTGLVSLENSNSLAGSHTGTECTGGRTRERCEVGAEDDRHSGGGGLVR